MKSICLSSASAALILALAPLAAFSQSVTLGTFNPELNNSNGTLSNVSNSGFNLNFTNAGTATNNDTRTILSASAGGVSIGIGETAVLSFTVSSSQIKNSSVEGLAFGFGFDMGPIIATTQMDVGAYQYTYLRSGAGSSGFPFAAVANGTGNSSLGTNSWVVANDPVPGTALATGSTLAISVGLSRIGENDYVQSVTIAGSSAYTSQFTLSHSSIETIYILAGGTGFTAFNLDDNISISNVSLSMVPEPGATSAMLAIASGIAFMCYRRRK